MRFPRRGGGAGSEEKGLPWAAAEAAYGAELFGTSAMLGAAASEEAVRGRLKEPHGIVCLSTHGSFEDPALASVLLLAGGQWLSVFELLGIGFATELVVLSACQSGQAVVRPGDEIEGFGAAVLAAGARGSALGLWKVDDRSTALLMSEFFTQLHSGAPPRAALADAQRWLRRLGPDDAAERLRVLREAAARAGHDPPSGEETLPSFDHPHHWASFTLLGR
jgi:CHAT domain-containing protein